MLKKLWIQEKNRLLLSSILFSSGLFMGVLLGSFVNIHPDLYYRPGQDIAWYNLALNNIAVALLIAGTGILLSIPTIIMLLFNGIMIGFIIMLSAAVHSYPTLLAGLLPHGILEIPALLLAGAIGLRPLGFFARAIKLREKIQWRKEARQSAALFAVVTVMLIAASLIEAHITPVIMDLTR
ncbi:stage II sporulation protein M [Paenibacillus sp. GSMTC-2017]|uniref:stage II sporulation protein M n=1 Tax=Paenibacillus sp. GSMTC-2017 TaxID=2794350 RepID=UPI0018D84293|nr:stage II sporulation protein M [Paenibacillus sp. GSMTC-2017]MBH5316316.1 stage II sporulation protein M [Paenibacillus sp. GSMTC-2017]